MLSKQFKKLVIKLILVNLVMLVMLVMLPGYAAADPIETFETNLNMSIADIIIIIVSCGCIVMVAFDSRIALMCAFLLYASIYIVFTLATEEGYTNFNPYYSGVAMMLCFVLICVALLVTYKKSNTPLNVV